VSRLGQLSPKQTGVAPVRPPLLLLHPDTRIQDPTTETDLPAKKNEPIGSILTRLRRGSTTDVSRALNLQKFAAEPLGQILLRETSLTEEELDQALFVQEGATHADLIAESPDPDLIDQIGAAECLERRLTPWKRVGSTTLVAVDQPSTYTRHQDWLRQHFGHTRMVLATRRDQHRVIARFHGAQLADMAETRPPDEMSCRSLKSVTIGLVTIPLAVLALAAGLGWAAEAYLFVSLLALAALAVNLGLRVAASVASIAQKPVSTDPKFFSSVRKSDEDAQLPVISVLVPLFKEQEIATRLLTRLQALDYPESKLDICLVVEADDWVTRHTISRSVLPSYIRTLSVPHRTLRTKPRAMNYAIEFCHGSIVGIYDAEDAPDPDQLRKVVRTFRESGQSVACLQGRLQYYNARYNVMSRCFAIDYALWFRAVLPGLRRLGFPIPLGGTTVFFRRQALLDAGAWDAHNVTEDADLGIRLARRGYKVALLDSATSEEATSQIWPWVRQRSRWIKGYAITYIVHMRSPWTLFRDLGAWRFLGFQALFLGSLTSVMLAPVLWSFWLVFFGMPHPLDQAMDGRLIYVVAGGLVSAEVLTLLTFAFATRHKPFRWLWPFVPVMHLYGMLVSIAGLKAMAELVFRPFFWDKTQHGVWKGETF